MPVTNPVEALRALEEMRAAHMDESRYDTMAQNAQVTDAWEQVQKYEDLALEQMNIATRCYLDLKAWMETLPCD